MRPLVSVIVPLYNYEKYIGWCIQSVINQDYPEWELIVVDDCSTDASYDIAKTYETSNITVIRLEENGGYSKAKNEGIIISKGEYIVTLDADDMLTKHSITPRVEVAMRKKVAFVHARAISVNGKMSLKDCYAFKKRKRQTPKIHAQTVLMSRKVYQKFGLYDESLRSRSDKEMWWRLFNKGCAGPFKIKKFFIKRDVAYYRRHGDSMMSFRKRNKKYNKQIARRLEAAFQDRRKHGITKKNTRFLET